MIEIKKKKGEEEEARKERKENRLQNETKVIKILNL